MSPQESQAGLGIQQGQVAPEPTPIATPPTGGQQVIAPSAEPQAEPTQQQGQTTGTTDWTQSEEFRNWQSNYDKQVATAKREAQQLQTQLQQQQTLSQQQIEQMQQQMNQYATVNMDDGQRLEWEKTQAEQQLNHVQQQLENVQQEQRRKDVLMGIAQKTGMPFEEIPGETYQTATDAAMDWQGVRISELESKISTMEAQFTANSKAASPNNSPDMGGGDAPGNNYELQKQYNEAMKSGNISSAIDIGEKAATELGDKFDPNAWRFN